MTAERKNYVTKKLPHYQVLRVMSRTKEGQMFMSHINAPFVIDGVPQGHFVVDRNKILLPKRRRGEKFVVHYTEVKEVIL